MPEEVSPEAVVSRPVSEVLQEQTTLLRSIDQKVDNKADKSDLVELVHSVREHDGRLVSLESSREWTRRMMAAGGVFLLAAASVIGGLIGGHVI